MMNRKQIRRAFLSVFAAAVILSATGCSSGKSGRISGQDIKKDIAGFLLHFDQREETRRLVSYIEKGQLPVKVSWSYPSDTHMDDVKQSASSAAEESPEEGIETIAESPGASEISEKAENISKALTSFSETEFLTESAFVEDGTESVAESANIYDDFEDLTESSTVVPVEDLTESSTIDPVEGLTESSTIDPVEDLTEAGMEETVFPAGANIYVTEDPDKINEIITAFNGIIIVSSGHSRETQLYCMVVFTLPDESTCTFSFISPTMLRIGDQNYTLESDGTLWPALSGKSS